MNRPTRKFQRVFGRTTTTKTLDWVLFERGGECTVIGLARAVGVSYQLMIPLVRRLESMGLVVRRAIGRRHVIRPNLSHPVVVWVRAFRGPRRQFLDP